MYYCMLLSRRTSSYFAGTERVWRVQMSRVLLADERRAVVLPNINQFLLRQLRSTVVFFLHLLVRVPPGGGGGRVWQSGTGQCGVAGYLGHHGSQGGRTPYVVEQREGGLWREGHGHVGVVGGGRHGEYGVSRNGRAG